MADFRPGEDPFASQDIPQGVNPFASASAFPSLRSLYSGSPKEAISGIGETVAQMGTGMVGQAAGGLRGLGTLLTGGGLDKAVENIRGTENAITYQPRTQAGKELSAAAAYLPEKANEGLGWAGEQVGGAGGRTIGENIIPVVTTLAGGKAVLGKARAAAEALKPAEVKYAVDNPGKMAAAQKAEQYGIAVDPAETNPTKLTKTVRAFVGGDNIDNALSRANQDKIRPALLEDIGIKGDAPLEARTFQAVRDAAGEQMNHVRQAGMLTADDELISGIRGMKQEPTIASPGSAHAVNAMVERAIDKVKNGAHVDEVLREIASLRKDARDIYKRSDAGPEAIATADSSIGIANHLEGMIDRNLTRKNAADPYVGYDDMLKSYREGRTRMAKTYTLEDVTDLGAKTLDPLKLGKIMQKDNALTGAYADIGEIASNFPEIVGVPRPTHRALPDYHLSRYSLGGVVGGLGGFAVGGPAGVLPGGLLGAGVSELGTRFLANKAASPFAQHFARNRVPESVWNKYENLPNSERVTDIPREPQRVFREPSQPEMMAPLYIEALRRKGLK